MKFKKQDLQDEAFRIVESGMVDKSRWSIHYRAIFEHEGKFYETTYSVGATEQQDERPYEYDPDEIECPEVHKVPKTIEVWERVT
jgi:RNA-splicing ligase RtcB